MLLEIKNLEKDYGLRTVISLKKLAVYEGDKVAVVGRNGSGKTTLLRLIAGEEEPDVGAVRVRGRVGVIPQFGGQDGISGGERTRTLIDQAFAQNADLLLADEPTTNLDIEAISCLEEQLCAYLGALLLVSHDRALLEAVCNKVLDIETGTFYGCGYEEYAAQKQIEMKSQIARYEAYAAEKSRLKNVAADKARQSQSIKKPPKRMGNSEARLHKKMGGQGAKAKLDKAAKAVRTRLEQLEPVEKPYREKDIVFDLHGDTIASKVLVSVRGASKAYAQRQVLCECSFDVPNGKKTALIGPNGAGKSTLLGMIADREEGIHTCARLKIGYFRQDINTLDFDRSVLENVMAKSAYDECFSRTILARLHFHRDELTKKAGMLSGGERLKLALACIILSGFNLLMLDEPTNFLDTASRNALETVLSAYPSAVLFVSHDRAFIKAVADRIVTIRDEQTFTFEGGWQAFSQA